MLRTHLHPHVRMSACLIPRSDRVPCTSTWTDAACSQGWLGICTPGFKVATALFVTILPLLQLSKAIRTLAWSPFTIIKPFRAAQATAVPHNCKLVKGMRFLAVVEHDDELP